MIIDLPIVADTSPIESTTINLIETKKEEKKPEVSYKVVKGDNLTKIAKAQNTTVQRLWDKNVRLTNPDRLEIDETLIIPAPEEVLPSRPLYRLPEAKSPSQPTGNASGNAYTPGQCTWAVKNWKPELPNNLGNASDWLANAQAQGMATGTEPRVGAVGWTSGHVVLITAVNPDGSVDIKDMNGRWVAYEIGYGRYPASKYLYIY